MSVTVPTKFRQPIAKYGPRVNRLARKRYGISGQQLLARLGAGESGFVPNRTSSAGAFDEYQFMPGTRDAFLKAFGVDAFGSPDEKVHAAELHLSGKGGHTPGLEGYNPGGGQDYVNYILGQHVRGVGVGASGQPLPRGKGGPRRPAAAPQGSAAGGAAGGLPAVDTGGGQGVAALLSALQAESRPSFGGAVPEAPLSGRSRYLSMPNVPQGGQAPEPAGAGISELLAALPGLSGPDGLPMPEGGPDAYPPGQNRSRPGSRPRGPRVTGGSISFAPNADRPGVSTNRAIKQFARQVSAVYGHPLTIGTGTRHSQYTTNNTVSQHWTGDAVDIPARGADLIRLGQAALIAAGASKKWARKQRAGLYNINGKQIIFGTNDPALGGDHRDHLHIGI